VKLLEMVKRREKMKKDDLELNIEVYEKRYQAKDFSGQLMSEYTSVATKSRYVTMREPQDAMPIVHLQRSLF
jgi:hypothetical protein